MSTPAFNPNPSAKARFQESSDNVSKHQKLIQQPEFQRGLDFARLEYQRHLAEGAVDMNKAAVAGIKIQAVEEFLIVLKYLAEKAIPFSAPKIVDNLPGEEQARRQ